MNSSIMLDVRTIGQYDYQELDGPRCVRARHSACVPSLTTTSALEVTTAVEFYPHTFVIATIDVDPAVDPADYNDWYNREHLPARLRCPGFVRGRRFQAVDLSPSYVTMYEVDDPASLETAEYLSLMSKARPHAQGSARTVRMEAAMTVRRNVYREIDLAT
jgi:hypothetical protein